ncbi:MAG: hypothetical protein ACJ0G4_00625 [Alphaproteobacteria bacterium]|tara:strand:- start:985 stop:1392 length:408 start_codon:yes stop_codon:yes gene_type:complete
MGSPIGKGLACQNNDKLESSVYQKFKGLFFETNKSVRVVSFKMKNNSLKVISKQTHYKISKDKIDFKIKFIWYGNISFEKYSLDRQSLVMNYENNNDIIDLKCRIVNKDFMKEMNEIKSYFQMNNTNNIEINKSF